MGFLLGRGAQHIELRSCRVERTFGPGIALLRDCEFARVLGCEVIGDYRLREGSPALGAAKPLVLCDTGPDIGACGVYPCPAEQ